MPVRNGKATWEGGLKGGKGSFTAGKDITAQYNFSARFEEGVGSNPEELLAAAHAACYSMALSAGLEKAGTPATRVDTRAECTIDKVDGGFAVTTMRLVCRATVPGVDAETFRKAAEATKDGCPISKALAGNVRIELDAALQ